MKTRGNILKGESKLIEKGPVDLLKHINTSHNGNVTAFARSIGSTYQQVQRYIKLDCIWHDGRVYAPKTKQEQNQ